MKQVNKIRTKSQNCGSHGFKFSNEDLLEISNFE